MPTPGRIYFPAGRRHIKWRFPKSSVLLGKTAGASDVLVDAENLARHMHVIGASGFGKTKLLEGIARQFILALDGEPKGLIVFDPHGHFIEAILHWVASYRLDKFRRIHLIDPGSDHIVGINPLAPRAGVDEAVIANTFANVVTAIWGDEGSMPQLAESLRLIGYSLCSLGWTLLEAELLTDIADPLGIRQFIIQNVPHPQIRRGFATLDDLPAAKIEEKLGAVVRRLQAFLLPRAIRRMLSQRDNIIDFRAAMDNGDIVLVNLSHGNGRISEDESTLLGRLILLDMYLSVLGRPEGSRQVLLMIDECQRFMIKVMADILDQSRKFGLSMVLAHQHVGHLREAGESIFRSVMTNTRTKVVFSGLDDDDATFMGRNLLRGFFPLEAVKHTFDKPTVVGQEYDWLQSESTTEGTSHTEGSSWSETESEAQSFATSSNWTQGFSDTQSASSSETISESATNSSSETDQWSHSDGEASGTSATQSDSWSRGENETLSQRFVDWNQTPKYRQDHPQSGARITDGENYGRGASSATGTSNSRSTSASRGGAHSTGRAETEGTAATTGTGRAIGFSATQGGSFTEGITHGWAFTSGESVSDTESYAETRGRAQTLRSVFATLPSTGYTLQELQYLGSVLLGSLKIGEAVAKIGDQPPVRFNSLYIKSGWASAAQVERLKDRLAAASPYVTPLPEARERYLAHRQSVFAQLSQGRSPASLPRASVTIDDVDVELRLQPPPLKNEGWG